MRRAAVATALVVLALSGCTSGDDRTGASGGATPSTGGSPSGSAEGSPSATPGAGSADALTAQVLGAGPPPAPLASAAGTLVVERRPVHVVADVLAVHADARGTVLQWRLRSAGSEPVGTLSHSLTRGGGLTDTRRLAVLDPVAKVRLQPYTYDPYQPDKDTRELYCTCSSLPTAVGPEGRLLYAELPPLAAGATTVDVLLPGFAPARGVAVTR